MYLHTVVLSLWLLGFLGQTLVLIKAPPKLPKRLTRVRSQVLNQYFEKLQTDWTSTNVPTKRLATVADLMLVLKLSINHALVQIIIDDIRTTATKLLTKISLNERETCLAKHVKRLQVNTETSDLKIIDYLRSLSKKELKDILPDVEVSIAEFDNLSGCHITIPNSCEIVQYGDAVSFDEDSVACIFWNTISHRTFLHKAVSGLFDLRPFSTAIRKGLDLSQLILLKKRKFTILNFLIVILLMIVPFLQPEKLLWLCSVLPVFQLCYMFRYQHTEYVPGEVRNFYYNWLLKKVYIRELDNKPVHLDGTPIPPNAVIRWQVVRAETSKLLERYAILFQTGRGNAFDKFKSKLSVEPLMYTVHINNAKIMDIVHWTIRHIPHMLAEVEVLIHILTTRYNLTREDKVVADLVIFKEFRDELFSRMKTHGVDDAFLMDWYKLVNMAFSLRLHEPQLCTLLKRTGPVEGLTEEHTTSIASILKKWEMSRLTFMKNFLFRLLQILYGYHVCLLKSAHMIYNKEELAEEVAQVLKKLGIVVSIEDLIAILHRDFSTKSDIRTSETLHHVFEKLVMALTPEVIRIFTKQAPQVQPLSQSDCNWDMYVVQPPDVVSFSPPKDMPLASEQPPTPICVTEDFPVAPKEALSVAPKEALSVAPKEALSVAPEEALSVAPEEACVVGSIASSIQHAESDEVEDCEPEQASLGDDEYKIGETPSVKTLWSAILSAKNNSPAKGESLGSIRWRVCQHYSKNCMDMVDPRNNEILSINDKEPNEKRKSVISRLISLANAHRLPILIMLVLTDFFGHGYQAFKNGRQTKKADVEAPQKGKKKSKGPKKSHEYNPMEDIDKILEILHENLKEQQPSTISKTSDKGSFSKYFKDIQEALKRWAVIHTTIAIYQMANRSVFLVIVDDDIQQQEISFSCGNCLLYVVSVHSKALSKDKLATMNYKLIVSSNTWKIYYDMLPVTSNEILIRKKTILSITKLKKEAMKFLSKNEIKVVEYILHGSIIHVKKEDDEKRMMCGDADFIVKTTTNPLTITLPHFVASDGTRCDFMFTTPWAFDSVEIDIAKLFGQQWSSELPLWRRIKAWFQKKKIEKKEPVVKLGKKNSSNDNAIVKASEKKKVGDKESIGVKFDNIADAYGRKIHSNDNAIVKASEEQVDLKCHYAFMSVKLIMTLMELIRKRKQYPVYDAYTFFPQSFNKQNFKTWVKENNFNPQSVVLLFTKQQLAFVNGVLLIQSGEKKYSTILNALPLEWLNVLVAFKQEAELLMGPSVDPIQATIKSIIKLL